MKHTQGKWEISNNGHQALRIGVNINNPLESCIICSLSGNPSSDEIKANAKLIAAAPELLDALIKIRDLNYGNRESAIAFKALEKLI